MRWAGRELRTREGWAAALRSVVDAADAALFLRLYRAEQPAHADAVVGYLLSELPPAVMREQRPKFGLPDPMNPDGRERSAGELLVAGMRHAIDGPPPWFDVAMSYPREDPNPSPYWPKEES